MKRKKTKILGMIFSTLILLITNTQLFATPEQNTQKLINASANNLPMALTISHTWGEQINHEDKPEEILLDLYASEDNVKSITDEKIATITLTKKEAFKTTHYIDTSHAGKYFYVELHEDNNPLLDFETATDEMVQFVPQDDFLWQDPVFDADSDNPLGTLGHYSAIVFGDVSVQGADVEAGIAMRGSLDHNGLWGQYAVGIPASPISPMPPGTIGSYNPGYQVGHKVSPYSPRMIVGGDIKSGLYGQLDVFGGELVLSENSQIESDSLVIIEGLYNGDDPDYVYDGSALRSEFDITDYRKDKYAGTETRDKIARMTDEELDTFFGNAYASTDKLSATLGSMQAASNVLVEDITLTSGQQYNYIKPTSSANIDYSQYNFIVYNMQIQGTTNGVGLLDNVDIEFPDTFDGRVIVNVLSGDEKMHTYKINGGDTTFNGIGYNGDVAAMFAAARKYSGNIIWNFPDANITNIDLSHHSMIGSMIAPNTEFTTDDGSINGNVVGQKLTAKNGFEIHSTTPYTSTPKQVKQKINLVSTRNSQEIILEKKDMNGKLIPGLEFILTWGSSNQQIATTGAAGSSMEGKISFTIPQTVCDNTTVFTLSESTNNDYYGIEPIKFTIAADGTITLVAPHDNASTSPTNSNQIDIVNEEIQKITIHKKAPNGDAIDGITFDLNWLADDGSAQSLTKTSASQNGESGIVEFELPSDYKGKSFTIVEHEHQEYEKIDAIKFSFDMTGKIAYAGLPTGVTVDASGFVIDVINVKKQYAIDLLKIDASDRNITLAGAEFELSKAGYSQTKITDSLGGATFDLPTLPLGVYTLTEIQAPEGYEILPKSISVTIDSEGKIISADGLTIAHNGLQIIVKNIKEEEPTPPTPIPPTPIPPIPPTPIPPTPIPPTPTPPTPEEPTPTSPIEEVFNTPLPNTGENTSQIIILSIILLVASIGMLLGLRKKVEQ